MMFLIVPAILMLAGPVAAEAPPTINYQGVLTDADGEPVNGDYSMIFSIYNDSVLSNPDNILWQEVHSSITVTDGLFSVILGLSTPLSTMHFTETGRYLGIKVGADPEISPRYHFTTAPYSFQSVMSDFAGKALAVFDNTITSASIQDGSITFDDLGQNGAAAGQVMKWQGGAWVAGDDEVGGVGWNWSDSSSHGPDSVLYADTGSHAYSVKTIDEATGGDIYGNLWLHSNLTVGDGSGEPGYVNITNGSDYTVHIGGKDASDNGALIRLDNSGGDRTIILDADDFQVGDVGGVLRLTDGVVPDTTITLDAWDFGGGAVMTMGNSEGDNTIILDARDTNEEGDIGARVTLRDGSWEAIILDAIDPITSFGAQLIMKVGNDTTVTIYANGDYGDGGGIIRLYDDNRTKTVHMDGNGANYGGAQVSLSDHDGTTTISLDAESGASDGGANVRLLTGTGTETIRLDANYGGTGEGRVITSVLEITGGSDLSEQFNVHSFADNSHAYPGMVVCIDQHHPGELIVSSKAYDPTVAGIISGAGGVKPGMLMGQAGSVSDGRYPVALTGRVYCRADALYGSIKPGDLLTTSDTPGHAMKVSDYAAAQGTIIGKAMSSLQDGKGLVLVLVNLQ
jgi:hypothetical protein